jgi:hypothetical protein
MRNQLKYLLKGFGILFNAKMVIIITFSFVQIKNINLFIFVITKKLKSTLTSFLKLERSLKLILAFLIINLFIAANYAYNFLANSCIPCEDLLSSEFTGLALFLIVTKKNTKNYRQFTSQAEDTEIKINLIKEIMSEVIEIIKIPAQSSRSIISYITKNITLGFNPSLREIEGVLKTYDIQKLKTVKEILSQRK